MTRLSDCQAALQKAKADLTTCRTDKANLTTQVADLTARVVDLQKQLDALDNPPPPSGFTPDPRTLGAYVNPYPTSVFNRPIPSNPAVHPNSQAMVAEMLSKGPQPHFNESAGAGGTASDYSHAVYLAKDTDPTMVLRGGRAGGSTWKNPATEGKVIHVPKGAREACFKVEQEGSAGQYDKSVAFIQPDGTEYDLWGVLGDFANDTIDHNGEIWHGFSQVGSAGGTGLNGGITEAQYALGLGVIRTPELLAGEIKHALFATVNGWAGRVYPAAPSQHTGQGSGANRPPMGGWLQLDPSLSLASFPKWKQTVLRAMQVYGMFIGDQGGAAACFWCHLESETPYVALGVSPTNLAYMDKQFGKPAVWDIGSGVDWSKLRVLQPPTP